jgi:hypothetical protein
MSLAACTPRRAPKRASRRRERGGGHYRDITQLLWTLADGVKPADREEKLMTTQDRLSKPVTSFVYLCLTSAVLGVAGCSSGSTSAGAAPAAPGSSSAVSGTAAAAAAGGQAIANGAPGLPDYSAICPKLPVADAQQLIRGQLNPAVADLRLGGCTFVLLGKQLADNNLTVAFETGTDAASRYSGDVKGTITIGGSTVSTGSPLTTPLTGVGDKAAWGSDAGYPTISALKGDVYCTVSTADDATQLTIIGRPGDPLPQGSTAQQAQYAQREGKLCTDLFAVVQ